MKKLLLVTDAWHPQVNGVVTVYTQLIQELEHNGIRVHVVHPSQFVNIPLPVYSDVRLSIFPKYKIRRIIFSEKPDHIHIATEGPLGWAARSVCRENGLAYTTSYHTHFDLYSGYWMTALKNIIVRVTRRFHRGSAHVMVATLSLKTLLESRGVTNVVIWPLGVDAHHFVRNHKEPVTQLTSPVFLYFGRLAPEKDSEEFFRIKLHGSRLVIGDGPDRAALEARYGGIATFVGTKKGEELVDLLSGCDVLIFTSRTETFGLVIVEALACGIPVAAHAVMGPRDIVTDGVDGVLSDDLSEAAEKCLSLDRSKCREKALRYSWEASAKAFQANLVPVAAVSVRGGTE